MTSYPPLVCTRPLPMESGVYASQQSLHLFITIVLDTYELQLLLNNVVLTFAGSRRRQVSLALTLLHNLLTDRPNLPVNPPVPAASNRRVLVRPPRPRYTEPPSAATPRVPDSNE